MPATSLLPLEMEETILNLLAEDDDDDCSALKACSLVCQAFLPICRKHIFRSIDLTYHGGAPPRTLHAFERLLQQSPEIANYIRKLDYIVEDSPSPSIQDSLKQISGLIFLTVKGYSSEPGNEFDWSDNPIRPALLHLLHLPTLIYFEGASFNNFVVSDLIPCVNLKYLHFGPFTIGTAETTFPAALPERSIPLNEMVIRVYTATVIAKLCRARRPDGQPIIDFRSLSKITLTLQKPNESEAAQELFRRCQNLANVCITFLLPREVMPSLSNMLWPSIQTLKHIVVEVHVDDVDVDPLFGVPFELEDMRATNIIESITIRVSLLMDSDCRKGGDWGRLDKVLTTPGWFNSLKRVSLAIEVASFSRTDEKRQVALRKLPEKQFLRLSTSNSVSFDFEVTSVLV
ncbi:hypothetical protein M413DRAFT_252216 [Hebeloma cylindrosporum]|uniref:F-box domain-containing protein n=1 Tax=Hebeloma cylindrosporum TaxID=76867 RepID=A0A0C3BMF3_HEBCY|nr:hypothetical protein M413DRAFT_252216 [Hebeloma cylindrosporum h7]